MLMIEKGDFSHPIEPSGQKEIALLAQSFNSMVMKVQELMARLVAQQKEKRKTEFRALQNQINPHFLYNTLDSIVWLAEHRRHKDVTTAVVSLARFFRISISKGETFITVDDELSHAQNYLTIQSIRYVDKFTYSMDIQDGMRKLKVMKLILLPLVENAIYHGAGDADGHIEDISGRIEDDFLVFRVRNSGYGISEDTVHKMYDTMKGGQERPSVRIREVYQRLKLYYGESAEVLISSEPDESDPYIMEFARQLIDEASTSLVVTKLDAGNSQLIQNEQISRMRQAGMFKDTNENGRIEGEDGSWIPVVGIDGLREAEESIRDGYLYGTVKNDSLSIAKAMAELADALMKGRDLSTLSFQLVGSKYVWIDYLPFVSQD